MKIMTTKIKVNKVTSQEAFTAAEDKRLRLNDAGKYPNYTTREYQFVETIHVTGFIHLEGDWENLNDDYAEELVKEYRATNRVDWHEVADNRDLHVLDSFMEKYDRANTTLITHEMLTDIDVLGYETKEHQWDDTKGYQIKLKE